MYNRFNVSNALANAPAHTQSIINNQTGFEIMGNDVSTGYSFGALQPPLFEVTVRVDPGEAFSFDFTGIDINLGCVPSPNFQYDESHFAISPVGLPFEGLIPATCDSESRNVEIFLEYPDPSILSAATVDIPLKIRDGDNPNDNILSLVFTTQEEVEVEDPLSYLSIDSALLRPLAFANDGTALEVRLQSLEEGGRPAPGIGTPGSEALSITPVPNPFQQGLSFHISAPAALEARLSIFNASGKQVYAEALALDAGRQKVQLPAADTWSEGAYFYHLEAGESIQSGRLIKLQ